MRLRIVIILLILLGLQVQPGLAEDDRPAGYIMAYELKGVDAEKGTVVVRKGSELAPKLLMPLYDNDAVFIRDEGSKITLSLAKEGNLVVSGKLMRKEITGEMASGDDGFSIIEQIADILIHEGEGDSFSVLVSKGGDEIAAPMVMRGRNYVLRNAQPLRVSWTGGEAPFSVTIADGKTIVQTTRDIEFPTDAIAANRFALTITDARKRKLRVAFELRKASPKVPDKIKARENRGEVATVWLAGQQNGAWRLEAARQLRALASDKTTADLLAALEKGWLPRSR